jgi:hypothetical protein
MLKSVLLCLTAIALLACAQKPKLRVETTDAVAEIQSKSRSEPIYYNGKTYTFDLKPLGGGQFALQVKPMSQAQEKDAIAVATSSLGYYACVSGKAGRLTNKPAFAGKSWSMTAVCS